MRMNDPQGKRLLAAVREGDYAHPGEEEAIRLTWEHLPKDPSQSCLDAGCGRGGTAAFVQKNGWARPTGIDIDAETIATAASMHPDIPFHALDIAQAGTRFPEAFSLIYAFNAFYAFPDQPAALKSLHGAAAPGATLCLFDYVDRGGFANHPFGAKTESRLWQPLDLSQFPSQLAQAGWQLAACHDIDSEYRRWYEALCERFSSRRAALLAEFPADLVDYATEYYSLMRDAVVDGALGGAIVYAQRAA